MAQASEPDSSIESSAKKSHVFKTHRTDDKIKLESRDAVVTLTGLIAEDLHSSLAEVAMTDIPGVRSVDNRLEIKGSSPIANSDAWLHDKVKGTLMFHMTIEVPKTKETI